MELRLKRRYKGKDYTIGDLYVNGKKFCETLEDTDRGLTSEMSLDDITRRKVYGKTAIPTGTYPVQMGIVSSKFKNRSWAVRWEGKPPRLLNVKGFVGILIHPLNTAEESLGCIGVGENKVVGKVINSVATFHKLMPLLLESWNRGEDITIEIS